MDASVIAKMDASRSGKSSVRIMASGSFLVGSGDCKDGRDKSNFTSYSKHITLIAKKDVIDGGFFS